jgi:hypothetical protein
MATYGVLKSNVNTGSPVEIEYAFAAPLNVRSNQPSYVTDTKTLKRNTLNSGVQRWEIDASIVPAVDPYPILRHTVVHGYTKPFYVRMPQLFRPAYAQIPDTLSFATVSEALSKTLNVTIDSAEGGNTILPIGEFIRFAGHRKVYLVVDSVANGGQNDLTIEPALTGKVGRGEQVFYGSRVSMHCLYDTSAPLGISFRDGILVDTIATSLVEFL